jgi:hypothetical protein
MMPAKLTGADKLLKALAAVEAEATDVNFHRAAAQLIVEAARPGSRSSRVRATGRVSATKGAGVVRFGSAATPWALPSHFGHFNRPQGGFMRPNPFLYDASDSRRRDVEDLFDARLDEALRSEGLD